MRKPIVPRDAHRYRAVPLPGSLRRLIAATSHWVPRLRRADWRREWEAELTYSYSRAVADGRNPGTLFLRALWAWLDALTLWTEELTMTRMLADVRLAIRGLRRSPIFAVVAVVTLALGIGANTAIFSVVNGVVIKPLPYPRADRLVALNFAAPGLGYDLVPFSEDFYVVMRDGLNAFENIAMYNRDSVNIVADGDPIRVAGANVTASVFDVLRVSPLIGRPFTAADTVAGAEPVVLIGHELWRTRYGSDPAIVGTDADMDGRMRRIVGVMPPGFTFPGSDTAVWKPYELDEANLSIGAFSNPGIGRLRDGVTLATAIDDVDATMQRYFESDDSPYSPAIVDQARFAPNLAPLKDVIVGDVRQALLVVLGTVALLLLIACANVANLFLVRAESRQREVSLRTALGAGRGDVARLFLVESLLLSIAGGIAGLGMGYAALRVFLASAPVAIPRLSAIDIDATVLVFTLAISLATGLLFGALPLLRTGRRDLAAALREGGRTATGSRSSLATRNLLVVAQVALALVLLVGAGLMVRSFRELNSVDPGFDPADRLAVQIALPAAAYPNAEGRVAFWARMRDRIAGLPGVAAVGGIDQLPMGDGRSNGSLAIEDHPTEEGALPPLAEKKTVLAGYFEAMGIPLLQGRLLQDGDGIDGARAVVVSRGFARHWWPSESALGKRLRNSGPDPEDTDADPGWYEIVGVVGDVHFTALEEPAEETVYFPTLSGSPTEHESTASMEIVLRADGTPTSLAAPVRNIVHELDPRLPISKTRPVQQIVADAMARTSFTLAMLGAASSVALLLGAIGIYGVISYIVSQRTQEIGVRIALGASRGDVQGLVVRRGMVLTAIGIVVGIAAAMGASSVLASLLYGVDPMDPVTYLSVVAALATVALLASWLPAIRAAATDPIEALRAD